MNQTVQTSPIPLNLPTFQQAWEYVVGELRAEISRGDFDTWIKPMRALGYQDRVFTLGVYNAYGRDWVESHLKNRLTQLLQGMFNERLSVKIVVVNGFYHGEDAAVLPAGPVKEPSAQSKAAAAAAQAEASPRKLMLQRAYGSERARLIQPERGMFVTHYFFFSWLPLIGHSAAAAILSARSMCYWNPMTGELRNAVETDMSELAKRASVSVRTMKEVLGLELVRRYFLRYKVRRVMTPNGIRTAGIYLQVRMDDPLTPEDQISNNLPEEERWYSAEFDDENDPE